MRARILTAMAVRNKGLALVQVNLQHCKAATDLLVQKILNHNSCLALISEPYYHRGKLPVLNSQGCTVLQGTHVGRPRTCIVAKDVDILLLPGYSSSDLTVGLLTLKMKNKRIEMVVASAYFPGDASDLPPSREVEALTQWCRQMRLPLLLGGDFNAKHLLWGSTHSERRGESIIDFLARNNLDIINRGNSPTFNNGRHQSVIDVTIASSAISTLVMEWRVTNELTMSDHKYIEFTLGSNVEQVSHFRNPKATNWSEFSNILQDKIGGRIASIRSQNEIENEVCVLTSALIYAYEAACPLRKRKGTKNVAWWNSEIANLRRMTHRSFLRALRNKTPENWNTYRDLKRKLKSLITKSKRESWRKYCGDVENVHTASRLQRVLKQEPTRNLSMLKRADGTYTNSKQEVYDHLFEVHFPGSQATGVDGEQFTTNYRVLRRNKIFAKEFITEDKVRWAISTFEPYKSAGPDDIFPMLLQQGKEVVVPILCRIYRACIQLAYIPTAWRHAKVVFIPKIGRPTYEDAKSYRPICLSPFCLKILERIFELEIKQDLRNAGGLHPRQHAYQTCRSTETALHDVVTVIEQTFSGRHYCLGVFLDIQGAFDNAPFKGIIRALKRLGTHGALVDLVEKMLSTRTVTCSLTGVDLCRQVTRGCPQGGVLSPLLWNILVNELLHSMDRVNIYCQFYADDGTLLVRSGSIRHLCASMQKGLNVVERWSRRNNMAVNPSKTTMVLFTRKLNRNGFAAPVIFGEQLQLSDSVKYLGITIDSKLSWKANVEARCG